MVAAVLPLTLLARFAALAAACSSLYGGSASGLLLVANKGDGTLSVVDPGSGSQIAVLREEGKTGHEVAVSTDGRLAYVPIYGDAGVGSPGTDGRLVRVIDLDRGVLAGTVDFGRGVRPHRPVLDPVRNLLYVTTELDNAVAVIDPSTLRIVGSIPTGEPQSHMLAVSRDGTRGYTSNVSTGTVSVLDLQARRLVTVIQAAPRIQRIALSADDRWVFTADQTALRLVVIDALAHSVSRSIPLPGLAFGIAATPEGRFLLATLPALNLVAVIDAASMRVVRTVEVPRSPQEILVRPDSLVAYVSCDVSAEVAVLNLATWQVDRHIGVGRNDDGLAWAPAR